LGVFYSIIAVLFAGCSGTHADGNARDAVVSVAAARVARTNLTNSLVIASEFRPFQEIDVHAKVSGYVKAIYVDVGDRVRQGQLLATLEIPELQDEVVQSEASVRESEENIRKAQGELERSESMHRVAHLAYSRLVEATKSHPGLVAQQDIDDAHGRDEVSEAEVSAAKASLAAAQQHLDAAKANQERLRSLYEYSRVTALFTGVVTKRYADKGSLIQAGTASQTQTMPLVQLAQVDLLRLVIPVPESVVAKVHLGGQVEVRVPSLGKVFQGTVARFADQVDMATRTMHTEVDVPNPRFELVPGMYAYASIGLDHKENVLAVPIQALDRKSDKATVYVLDANNKVEARVVQTGIETPDQVEIISGLQPDDVVVVGGRSQVRPGQVVRPKFVAQTRIAEPGTGEN
jgi:RND family efflux transporter MFP subunit